MLRLWNFYYGEYIKQESPQCNICNNIAIGDFYDRDWQRIKLCKECYEALVNHESNKMGNNMRIIIAGSRSFDDYKLLKNKCNEILFQLLQESQFKQFSEIEIISGTAKGADQLGERFAKEHNFKLRRFPANWKLYGKQAGYLRNVQMAEYAKEDNGVLIAFHNGESKGTKHMINIAKKHKLRVFVINYTE